MQAMRSQRINGQRARACARTKQTARKGTNERAPHSQLSTTQPQSCVDDEFEACMQHACNVWYVESMCTISTHSLTMVCVVGHYRCHVFARAISITVAADEEGGHQGQDERREREEKTKFQDRNKN